MPGIFLVITRQAPSASSGLGGFSNAGGVAGTLPDGSVATEGPPQRTLRVSADEESSPVLLKRIRDDVTGGLLDAQECAVITVCVYDLSADDPRASVAETTLHWEEVLFEKLELTSDWSYDQQGYNFRYQLPRDFLPDGDSDYLIECVFSMLGSVPTIQFYDVVRRWRIRTRGRYGT